MKFYEMTSFQTIEMGGGIQQPMRSQYDVPYERNDEYVKLLNQMNPRNPESLLEPESGMLLHADINFEYNYYVNEYQIIGNKVTQYYDQYAGSSDDRAHGMKFLPSLNMFLLSGSGLASGNQQFQQTYGSIFLLYENLRAPIPPGYQPGQVIMQIAELAPVTFTTPENTLSRQFFQKVGTSYGHLELWDKHRPSSVHASIWNSKHTRVKHYYPGMTAPEFISIDMARIYADPENKREMFPYFAKINLSGVRKNGFCDLLQNLDLEDDFINFLIAFRSNITSNVTYHNNTLLEDGTYGQEEFSADVYGYSVAQFISNLLAGQSNTASMTSHSAAQSTCSQFESYLNALMFQNALHNWLQSAPVEQAMPVAFRLEKYLETNNGSTLVSTHYFFNYSELLEFKYYDTVVSYRDTYRYNMKVINATVFNPSQNGSIDLFFTEEPFYGESIYILDSPPVAPDVEILTYRGIADKNLILLNQMIDKEALVPIFINPSDYEQFYEQYTAQNIDPLNPIIFESDSPSDFEVFRLPDKPSSYAEFAKGKYKYIESRGANSVAYEDQIVPNKYYYYIFRAQDPNGFPSNPSPVYEFVLLKDGETMYPRTRIIDLKPPDPPTQKSKTFKKYIKIGFSPRQYTFKDEDMAETTFGSLYSEVNPGVSDDNIIGSERVFKFRIRSKNTGKLIDINVTFKKNNVIQA